VCVFLFFAAQKGDDVKGGDNIARAAKTKTKTTGDPEKPQPTAAFTSALRCAAWPAAAPAAAWCSSSFVRFVRSSASFVRPLRSFVHFVRSSTSFVRSSTNSGVVSSVATIS
jgi:hypothetical protein